MILLDWSHNILKNNWLARPQIERKIQDNSAAHENILYYTYRNVISIKTWFGDPSRDDCDDSTRSDAHKREIVGPYYYEEISCTDSSWRKGHFEMDEYIAYHTMNKTINKRIIDITKTRLVNSLEQIIIVES